ncbi:Xylose isomerase domain-containing protein TIM barrel (plasmid) [Gemmatirosa kalamazoonensis]|uniref:Xylose isomerase domain-containing protein TIM barrel n=1 Tax=Gemmatirosa kalamazoonensis TaxID=861299 RepID=W0RPU0_9BACT|nr:sugar phosphate isomerase/epimerase [Gemmatirosa kalamazoonensis]AHG92706.1 Xylose isomerase domain-containing protein TIM barrel [Gemmatirosa kalamazoonensis]
MSHARSRRLFLRDLAAATLGGGLLAACARASANASANAIRPTADRVGVQLFTVRDRMQTDFEGTLAQVAQAGYREVEFFSYNGRTPEQVKAALDRAGLTAPSTHAALRPGPDLEKQLAGYQLMGHRYAAAGGPPPAGMRPGGQRPPMPPPSVDGVRRTIEQYNEVAAAAKPYGIKVLVHNHTMEFQPLPDGRTPYDVLLAELDPERVVLELDIGWATVAGQRALDLFAKHPGRFPLWHVKDMAGLAALAGMTSQAERQRAAKIVPVGQGEIDYRPIFAQAATAGLQHFFVEQDTAPDSGDSIAALRASIEGVRRALA